MKEVKLKKKERSRIKIMNDAKELFNEHGIDNVTFQQIADKSDVCRTTVFNHFATTRDLLVAIYEDEMKAVLEFCEASGIKGKELIYMVCDKLIDDTICYPVLTAQLSGNIMHDKEINEPIKKLEKIIIENIPDYYTNKEDTAIIIMGTYFGIMNHFFINNKEFDAEEAKQKFRTLMGILASGKYE